MIGLKNYLSQNGLQARKNKRGDKMKKTLLEDLEKNYHSIKCKDKDNSYCIFRDCNKSICDRMLNLICSMRKIYSGAKK